MGAVARTVLFSAPHRQESHRSAEAPGPTTSTASRQAGSFSENHPQKIFGKEMSQVAERPQINCSAEVRATKRAEILADFKKFTSDVGAGMVVGGAVAGAFMIGNSTSILGAAGTLGLGVGGLLGAFAVGPMIVGSGVDLIFSLLRPAAELSSGDLELATDAQSETGKAQNLQKAYDHYARALQESQSSVLVLKCARGILSLLPDAASPATRVEMCNEIIRSARPALNGSRLMKDVAHYMMQSVSAAILEEGETTESSDGGYAWMVESACLHAFRKGSPEGTNIAATLLDLTGTIAVQNVLARHYLLRAAFGLSEHGTQERADAEQLLLSDTQQVYAQHRFGWIDSIIRLPGLSRESKAAGVRMLDEVFCELPTEYRIRANALIKRHLPLSSGAERRARNREVERGE